MTNQGPTVIFGFYDSSMGAAPSCSDGRTAHAVKTERLDAAAASAGNTDHSTSLIDNDILCGSSGWGYQDIPGYDFNWIASSVAADNEEQQAQGFYFRDNNQGLQPEQQNQQQLPITPRTLPSAFLTRDRRRRPQNVTTPPHLQYDSRQSEPSSLLATNDGRAAANTVRSSPDEYDVVLKAYTRKRKSSGDYEDDEYDDDDYPAVKNTCHNMIEKRYRANLNDKIDALRASVPSARIKSKSTKGEVISNATKYIHHLEERNDRLLDENQTMQTRIAVFEHPIMAGATTGTMARAMASVISSMQQPPTKSSPLVTPRGCKVAKGMLQVPNYMEPIGQQKASLGTALLWQPGTGAAA